MKPHRGAIILVFGILSLIVCPPLGIAAWVMAGNDLEEIAAGRMDPAGLEMTKAGRILGIIATAYFILWVFAVILFVVFRLLPRI